MMRCNYKTKYLHYSQHFHFDTRLNFADLQIWDLGLLGVFSSATDGQCSQPGWATDRVMILGDYNFREIDYNAWMLTSAISGMLT